MSRVPKLETILLHNLKISKLNQGRLIMCDCEWFISESDVPMGFCLATIHTPPLHYFYPIGDSLL